MIQPAKPRWKVALITGWRPRARRYSSMPNIVVRVRCVRYWVVSSAVVYRDRFAVCRRFDANGFVRAVKWADWNGRGELYQSKIPLTHIVGKWHPLPSKSRLRHRLYRHRCIFNWLKWTCAVKPRSASASGKKSQSGLR